MLDQARQRSDGDVAVGDDGLPDLPIEEYTPSYEPEEAAGAGQKGPDKPGSGSAREGTSIEGRSPRVASRHA